MPKRLLAASVTNVVHARQVARGQAAVFGCEAEVDWLQDSLPYYPPTVNNPDTTAFAMRTIDKYVADVMRDVWGESALCVLLSPQVVWRGCSWGSGANHGR